MISIVLAYLGPRARVDGNMKRYDFYKYVNKTNLSAALDLAGLTPNGLDTVGTMTIIRYETDLSPTQYAQLRSVVDAQPQAIDAKFQTMLAVMYAQEFCNHIVIEFIADSLIAGVRNVEGIAHTIRDNLVDLRRALSYGNVPDAILILKAFPNDKKIATFLDDVVILRYVNKLELYAGLALSGSL